MKDLFLENANGPTNRSDDQERPSRGCLAAMHFLNSASLIPPAVISCGVFSYRIVCEHPWPGNGWLAYLLVFVTFLWLAAIILVANELCEHPKDYVSHIKLGGDNTGYARAFE